MKKILYISLSFFGMLSAFTSCKTDDVGSGSRGEVPITLSGMTRNDGINGDNIYLKAVNFNDTSQVYINETQIRCPGGLESTPKNLTLDGGTRYYPLGDNQIRFFAYSGSAPGGIMTLRAGKGYLFDAVLSNYGSRKSDNRNVNISYEGKGTPGNSVNPAEILQFRHVMTRLIVSVVVNENEKPVPVDPAPNNVEFRIDGIVAEGFYPITAETPIAGSEQNAQMARPGSGVYTIQKDTNYIVPTGENLTGKKFSYLKIDDYTATAADRDNFTIQPLGANQDLVLIPGFSYNMVITVERLRVVSVTLEQIPWVAEDVREDDLFYEPKVLEMNLGDYDEMDPNDKVVKVVLHTSDNRLWVGQAVEGEQGIQFVTLPEFPSSNYTVDRADIYTVKGLLLEKALTNEYNGTSLNLQLSDGGMVLENPLLPNDQTNPYLITTPVQFLNLDKNPALHYRMENNIDLDDIITSPGGEVFTGFSSLTGSINGNGYLLSHVNIDGSGLFAVNNGTIMNIRIFSGVLDATGKNYAGFICGTNNGTIVASFNEGYIINSTSTVGGICGLNSATGSIIACLNTGNIIEGSVIGGIAGENQSVTPGAFAANINTGSLNKNATTKGAICGSSVATPAEILRSCYWLVGTVQAAIGDPEYAVGTNNTPGIRDSEPLSPDKLRDGISNEEQPTDRITYLLNQELAVNYGAWAAVYEYKIDRVNTGSTWPVAVKK